jgi:hypothetical protein
VRIYVGPTQLVAALLGVKIINSYMTKLHKAAHRDPQ